MTTYEISLLIGGFLIGVFLCYLVMLYLLKLAMESGRILVKQKNGEWYPVHCEAVDIKKCAVCGSIIAFEVKAGK